MSSEISNGTAANGSGDQTSGPKEVSSDGEHNLLGSSDVNVTTLDETTLNSTPNRRTSSRRRNVVNYDMRIHHVKKPRPTPKELEETKAEPELEPELANATPDFTSSPIFKAYIPPPLVRDPVDPSTKLEVLKNNLVNIILDTRSKIDELFQLNNYTSLVSFDPRNINREGAIYKEFAEANDLWTLHAETHSQKQPTRRRHIRSGPSLHPFQNEIESLVNERLIQKLKEEEKEQLGNIEDSDDEEDSDLDEKIAEETPEPVESKPNRKRSRSNLGSPAKPQPPTKRKAPTPKKKPVKQTKKPVKSSSKADRRRDSKLKLDLDSELEAEADSGAESLDQESDSESEISSTDSEDSYFEDVLSVPIAEPYQHIRKIRLIAREPRPIVTNPGDVTTPKFKDLESFLASYKSLDDDLSLEDYEKYMQDQNLLVDKIRTAIREKTLRIDFDENVDRTYWNQREEPTMIKKAAKVPPFKDPFKVYGIPTHHDHLVAQGVHSLKLFQDLRRQRIQRCRRISQMIETHFKRKALSKDREKKEYELKMLRLAKETARLVKRKWLQAEKAWKILEDRRKEQERVQRGKQHLTEMLEHSTQLLEQQLTNRSNSATTPASPESKAEQSDSGVDSGSEESSKFDSDEFSSESESELEQADTLEEGISLVEDDSKLSVEALREKYKNISEESAEVPEAKSGHGSLLAELYNSEDVKVEEEPKVTEEEQAALEAEGPYDPLLDSDTTASSDDTLSSEESDAETASSSADELDDSSSRPTLASLFGGSSAAIVDDSDDESVNSDDEDIKSETSLSTPNDEAESHSEGVPLSKESDPMTNEQVNSVVDVPTPPLLRGNLRIYQKQGLNWLAGLYNNNTNGILADEMGLGKTIQTISLISYLACEKHIWGPHLIVVPTSVMLNWEMEFKRFAPGMKVLTYYGSPQQRKEKRKGWNNPDSFHVCITSYQLVVHDQNVFRRKKWRYMILDEAHNIKNFRSQRWQALLNFNTEHRLLLTGTPLQNSIMELWSLLYFLMPSTKADQSMPAGFANLQDFQQWFGKPVDKIIEGGGTSADADDDTKKTVSKLHQVLRPYLLRRLKADVEKQMPAKYEHIVYCRLSKRQRFLYDDFMSRAQTKETLASGNFLSIINCLMQLRKVCNHPDLFEVRPIVTSFAIQNSVASGFEMKELVVRRNLSPARGSTVDLKVVNAVMTGNETITTHNSSSFASLNAAQLLEKEANKLEAVLADKIPEEHHDLELYYRYLKYKEQEEALSHTKHTIYLNNLRCHTSPIYGSNLLGLVNGIYNTVGPEVSESHFIQELIKPLSTRSLLMQDTVEKYAFVTPSVVLLDMKYKSVTPELGSELIASGAELPNPFHQAQVKLSVAFPDKSLLQYDCGKLQKLAVLLQQLKDNGHRALIFTQMTKVLDILELFLSYHGYKYMRLDGATKIEDRQILTERFNTDPRITCFILSTRSGGLGINLTGADTVIFYDSDWNPAMDKQCQDRCHRIGQTRDVHIYRFVSEYTIESNILRKANQKRQLDNVVIQEGDFTTDYFGKLSVSDLLGDDNHLLGDAKPLLPDAANPKNFTAALAQAEDEDDATAANVAMKEVELDNEDFDDPSAKAASASRSATPAETTVNEEEEMEIDEDDMGHIDEYMIRFIEGGYYWD